MAFVLRSQAFIDEGLRSMRYIFILLLVVAPAFGGRADGAGSGERECYRPGIPLRSDFSVQREFNSALEDYYSQASTYIDCLSTWIEEARRRYQMMFTEEAQTYLDERLDVMSEMRSVIAGHR